MTTRPRYTVQPVHLAEVIQDEMRERGWTITDLVMHMGPHFSERDWGICQLSWEMFFACAEANKDILLGERMAQQLAAAFDVSPALFTNLHENWRNWKKEQP